MFLKPAKNLPHGLVLVAPQDPALLALNENQFHAYRHRPTGCSPAMAALVAGGRLRVRV
jgi:hypothetical protein